MPLFNFFIKAFNFNEREVLKRGHFQYQCKIKGQASEYCKTAWEVIIWTWMYVVRCWNFSELEK